MSNSRNFALVGVGGFVAARHLQAIKEVGGNLLASMDKNDSVGIIDRYFPDSSFFVEFERFDRHLEKLKRNGASLDYLSICSPNYLHDAHIRFAMRQNAHAICEKPLVLNPWNIDALKEIEKESDKKIYNILQLRLHPSIIKIKEQVEASNDTYDFDLTYITSRGKWYDISWKGDLEKSGGIATNIGVHFFDMLTWIFGDVKENKVHVCDAHRASGVLELERANVRWFLSINYDDIPTEIKEKGMRTYRTMKINDEEIEFSDGFTDLHTRSYEEIIKGNGFGIDEARKSIEIVHNIRNASPFGKKGAYHPFLKNI